MLYLPPRLYQQSPLCPFQLLQDLQLTAFPENIVMFEFSFGIPSVPKFKSVIAALIRLKQYIKQ